MDIQTAGMIGGAFLAGTLVPYIFKKLMALRKKEKRKRYRRPVPRRIHRFFPENPDE
jgi:hypothetical protein